MRSFPPFPAPPLPLPPFFCLIFTCCIARSCSAFTGTGERGPARSETSTIQRLGENFSVPGAGPRRCKRRRIQRTRTSTCSVNTEHPTPAVTLDSYATPRVDGLISSAPSSQVVDHALFPSGGAVLTYYTSNSAYLHSLPSCSHVCMSIHKLHKRERCGQRSRAQHNTEGLLTFQTLRRLSCDLLPRQQDTLSFCSRQNMHTTMCHSGPDDPPLGPWQRRAACQRCSIALHCGMLACPLQHTDRAIHTSGWFRSQVIRLPGPKPVVGSEESPLPARATKGPAGSVTSPPFLLTSAQISCISCTFPSPLSPVRAVRRPGQPRRTASRTSFRNCLSDVEHSFRPSGHTLVISMGNPEQLGTTRKREFALLGRLCSSY